MNLEIALAIVFYLERRDETRGFHAPWNNAETVQYELAKLFICHAAEEYLKDKT